MTDFLFKSSLSLLVLLAVYHLALENQKMHQFNRFYLLFSLIFSMVLPFITIEIVNETVAPVPPPYTYFSQNNSANNPINTQIATEASYDYTLIFLWSLYAVITSIFLFRFLQNIVTITSSIKSNTKVEYKTAKLVLMDQQTPPHTFLNHIFLSKTDYQNRKIEEELYTHELIHVTQKHTLDVLLVETLKTVFWFNPLFIFYKKAIQLNHEFLADEKVVNTYNDIPNYQNLLLAYANANTNLIFGLTSNLNYSITKKRFIMMTKTVSRTTMTLCKIALLPLFSGLIYLMCVETVAQEKKVSSPKDTKQIERNSTQPNNTKDKQRDAYYGGVRIIIKDKVDNSTIDKMYEELTLEEKRIYLDYLPETLAKKHISAKEYNDFKDSKKYAIWIDEKNISNKTLENYSPKDFSYFNKSSVYKNARSKKFPQPFQCTLYTHNYFDKKLKNSHLKFGNDTLKIFRDGTIRVQNKNKGFTTVNLSSLKKATINGKKYNQINDTYFDEEGAIDSSGNKLKDGYIMINNQVFFYVEKNGAREYYHRHGFRVNSKGEKNN